MRKYQVTITGNTPLLMHWDNIDWSDKMSAWKNDSKNKKTSVAGDDRSPAWRWIGCIYHDNKFVGIPSDNLMKCISEGAAMVPTGKGQKTFKAQTQSGMMINESLWPLSIDGELLPAQDVFELLKIEEFNEHKLLVSGMGFGLLVKRAKIGKAKHVRVRPKFDNWALSGTIDVWDAQITDSILTEILTCAGQYKGLGDWRPSSPAPGSFGIFEATVNKVS